MFEPNTIAENLGNRGEVFIVGNEVQGVSEELSAISDAHIELPMRGVKQSLNVSVATGIVGYELARAYIQIKENSHAGS